MNLSLLRNTAREALWLAALAGVGLFGFEILFVYVVGDLAESLLGLWRQLPFISRMLKVLAGIDVSGDVALGTFHAVGFVHPIVLIVLCAVLVTVTTRVIVAEIDRGTADLLLTLPLSRTAIYLQTSAVWVLLGALLAGVVWSGVLTGVRLFSAEPAPAGRFAVIAVNLFALYCAVGGMAMMASTFMTRRGWAIGWIIGTLLVSFLISFFEALWPPIARIGWLGFLHWYRPVDVVAAAGWPVASLAVLGCVGLAAWSVGWARFARMDVPAA